MKLSLKQKALLHTLVLFGTAIVTSVVVAFIMMNVSTQVLMDALGVGLIAFFGYMVYSINLSRLEYDEKLKDLKDLNKKG